MPSNVTDSRSAARFKVDEPLHGSFANADVVIQDLAESGVQIEHAEPLRLATTGRLALKLGETAVTVPAIVIWSRLSQTPNAKGKLLYRSGLRLEASLEKFAKVINTLAGSGLLRSDHESLDRKRQKIEEKEQLRASRPVVMALPQVVSIAADQLLLIQHARERLQSNPDEAVKWYNRAKFSLNEEGHRIVEAVTIQHRDEVLAVWEYLERSIDIMTIVRAFDRKG
jgi:hypothetical protein